MSEIERMNKRPLTCGACGDVMSREANAKWYMHNYVCYRCNHGFRFEGIWDYDREEVDA